MANDLKILLDGHRAQYRLVESVSQRTPEFAKRVKKNRSKAKLAKASRKRNRR